LLSSAPRRLGVLLVALCLFLVAPAVAQASWGSIAIDPETGSVGTSTGKNTAAAAKRAAKNDCGDKHCKSAVWVFNGWGATVQKKSGLYVSAIGTTRAKAISNARQRAHEKAPLIAVVFAGLS
jgi:uncharacterized protein DUF4189